MLWTVIGLWEPHPDQEQGREGHQEPCETHRTVNRPDDHTGRSELSEELVNGFGCEQHREYKYGGWKCFFGRAKQR